MAFSVVVVFAFDESLVIFFAFSAVVAFTVAVAFLPLSLQRNKRAVQRIKSIVHYGSYVTSRACSNFVRQDTFIVSLIRSMFSRSRDVFVPPAGS